jgi:hypothetical protein
MTDLCIACKENSVDITELYCFTCNIDRELEAMIGYGYTDQLFLTKEAN